ncbi:two-component regulator propeller domain-containing protein [uncultured Bacteroides sp.]|uniref:hybrid sensor histidine kinase/response regulator transcription factor n=1 Tax=uncultured Bacteroides sp. TaxID=162156 RepID=UPI002AA7076F|nr:two-component regulator propeller domain-containing protein [uncultured Bacteroides sp.]
MKKTQLIISFFIFFLTGISVYAQPDFFTKYYFKNLNIRDGLSQSTVNAILQDSKGFMWFGTKDGLNRYDGLSFRVFKFDANTKKSIGNNFITALYEDQNGNMFVGTDAGLYIYSPITDSFKRFSLRSAQGTSIEHSVTSIISDKKGGIWISVDSQGLFYYEPTRETLINYFSSKSKKFISANITRFWFDDNGTCWLCLYDDNLYYTKDHFKTLKPFVAADGSQPFKDDIINKLVSGPHHYLYVGSSKGGLKEIDLATNKVRTLLLKDESGEIIYAREIAFYSKDEIWVGSESGLFIYHLKTGKFTHHTCVNGDPYSLTDNAIYSLFKDKEGGMWIGSYFGGINYYPKQYTYFEKFYSSGNTNRDLGKRVREFCESNDGTIWIGTEDKGLFNYNPATGAIKPFTNPAIYHNVHGLCLDGDYLWIGTFAKGLNRLNLKTKEIKSYHKGTGLNTLSANDIFTICRSASGALWIGTTYGLMRYNRQTDDFTRIPELNGKFIYDIKEDAHGNLWLATYANGAYRYDINKKKWKNYLHNENDNNSLPYDKVVSIFEDSQRQIWLTTQGRGFCKFNPASETFTRYGSKDGLPNDVIYQIVEDENGMFWITTNAGLVRFNPQTKSSKVFTVANGLLGNQFNFRSGFKAKNGTIYFGSIDGFISFNPETFSDNKYIPYVAITDFLLFNKSVFVGDEDSPLKKSITYSDAIVLDADQNSFSLRIAALSYQAPQMNRLMYKLDGFDKEWLSVTGNSLITYSNLEYGDYVFRVRASNSDGVWNNKETTLHIKIRPPFYLSVWAYCFYVLFISASVVYVISYFKKKSERKHQRQMEKFEQEKEHEIYNAKIDFFTNVAHEIRTPLTLIKGPLENIILKKNVDAETKEDLSIMNRNTERLLNLTNQLLDFRKTESQGFRLSFIKCNISDLLRETYLRFTPLTKQRGIDFKLNVPETDFYAHVDKEAFTKILSNLFNNAVKYSESYIHATLVVDSSQQEAAIFRVRVVNDGQIIPESMRDEIFKPFVRYDENGMNKQTTGTGIGLALSRSLAELHQGSLRMDNVSDCNSFCLTLPAVQNRIINLDMEPVNTQKEDINLTAKPIKIGNNKSVVLVVEDNPDMLSFVVKQLSPIYTVLTAVNGKEALEVLDNNYVNLVVSDVMMPQMGGFELCRIIKSDLNYSHIPVVLLTAKTNLQSKIEGLDLGADAYIDKPFSVEYLLANIANLIQNREKLRQAFAKSPFLDANTMAMTKADEEFLEKLNDIIQTNLHNPDFSIDDMADTFNMSRSSFYRKIKGVLDLTPNDYLRLERLKKAAQLLKEGENRVNEICYIVGFNSPSYFSKCFQKQFGVLPKDFVA